MFSIIDNFPIKGDRDMRISPIDSFTKLNIFELPPIPTSPLIPVISLPPTPEINTYPSKIDLSKKTAGDRSILTKILPPQHH